jgi:hypothetical protein
MHPLSRFAFGMVMSAAALCGLQACSSTREPTAAADPEFGNAYRSALRAQELPPANTAPSEGVPYTELGPALERQQSAKPVTINQGRNNLSPAGNTGR